MTRKTDGMTAQTAGVAEEMNRTRATIICIRKAGNKKMTVNVATDRKEEGLIRISMRERAVATREVARWAERNMRKVVRGAVTVGG
jgi:hypothetical protein